MRRRALVIKGKDIEVMLGEFDFAALDRDGLRCFLQTDDGTPVFIHPDSMRKERFLIISSPDES